MDPGSTTYVVELNGMILSGLTAIIMVASRSNPKISHVLASILCSPELGEGLKRSS